MQMMRSSLSNVLVSKEDLLSTLKENRAKHIEEYNEAVAEYKVAFKKLVKKLVKASKSEDISKYVDNIDLDAPFSAEKDYDRAIQMVDMSVENEIKLDATQFDCLVLDNWDWKHSFLSNKMAYASAGNTR